MVPSDETIRTKAVAGDQKQDPASAESILRTSDGRPMPSRFVMLGLGMLGLVALEVALLEKAVPLEFWPLEGPQDFIQRLTPVLVVTIFIERALEVFISAWRGSGERRLKARVTAARRSISVTAGRSVRQEIDDV